LGLAAGQVAYDVLCIERESWLLAFSPGVAAGVTWLRGTAVRADVRVANASDFYADARVRSRLQWRTRWLEPWAVLEAGRAAGFNATQKSQTFGATGGWFAGAALGVAMLP
jgi:hypothetical protein